MEHGKVFIIMLVLIITGGSMSILGAYNAPGSTESFNALLMVLGGVLLGWGTWLLVKLLGIWV